LNYTDVSAATAEFLQLQFDKGRKSTETSLKFEVVIARLHGYLPSQNMVCVQLIYNILRKSCLTWMT